MSPALQAAGVDSNPAFDRLAARLPATILATLTPEQLSALEEAIRPANARHRVDYRVSIPWIGGRYYIALFAGRERRSMERLRQEGQISIGRVAGTYGAVLATISALMILSAGVLAYSLGKIFEDPMTQTTHARSWR